LTIASLAAASAPPSADQMIAPFLGEIVALLDAGERDQAIARVEGRLEQAPADAAALTAMGHLGFLASDFALALEALREAHDLAPASAVIAEALAILYGLAGELAEATYYAKLSQANGLDEATLALFPRGWPRFTTAFSTIGERPFLARGLAALARGEIDEALKNLAVQAAFSPNDGMTQRALADAELAAGHPRRAADILARFAANATADSWDLSRLGLALACAGEAQAARGICAEAAADLAPGAEADLVATRLVATLFDPATPREDAPLAALVAQIQGPLCGAAPIVGHVTTAPRRIGVLAAALTHPRDLETIAVLGQGLRDSGAAELVVFGNGALAAPRNRLLQSRVSRHIDAADFDGDTLAYTIASENLDILLDAGGIGAALHLSTLAQHPAGCTAAWLNGAFTGFAPGLDLMIGGGTLDLGTGTLPVAACAAGLVGRLERNPCLITGNAVPLLGADILPGQLHDELLQAWAAILARVPQARLLLRDREMSHPDNVASLIARASALGIADRIEIVDGVDHAFTAGLDLLLTPFVAADGHDVVTAAAVATPAVALAGPVRHRRFAAAALATLGLGAQVAQTVDGYVEIAVGLIGDPQARQRTADAAAAAPAFAPQRFAQALLDALREAAR
jgi:tetratricopeptide (TPR) repeat protein